MENHSSISKRSTVSELVHVPSVVLPHSSFEISLIFCLVVFAINFFSGIFRKILIILEYEVFLNRILSEYVPFLDGRDKLFTLLHIGTSGCLLVFGPRVQLHMIIEGRNLGANL